jgi:glycosyltransferase involved in cell wall biosynthesis
MKISYLVTCHNEVGELHRVLSQLSAVVPDSDEIVVLDDFSDEPKTREIFTLFEMNENVRVVQHELNGNFGEHKTWGSRQCTGDWIFQLDADEYLAQPLLENIHEILEANPTIELIRIPRVNIVRGMTEQDAKTWGWKVCTLPAFGDLPIINWVNDFQSRLYRNKETIYWKKALHETIVGAEYAASLPLEVVCAIIHDKTIDRQIEQNRFYNKNWSPSANMGKG